MDSLSNETVNKSKKRRFANESPKSRERRLEKKRELDKKRRKNETPKEREERLQRRRKKNKQYNDRRKDPAVRQKRREREKQKRENETPEQRERRKARDRESAQKRYHEKKGSEPTQQKQNETVKVPKFVPINETEEEKQARLKVWALQAKIRRENETPEQRERRLQRYRNRAKKKLDTMTPKQRAERLKIFRENSYLYRRRMKLGETEEEKLERLKKNRVEIKENHSLTVELSKWKEELKKAQIEASKKSANEIQSVEVDVLENPLSDEPINLKDFKIKKAVIKIVDVGRIIKKSQQVAISSNPTSFDHPHKCSICPQSFEYKSSLIVHELQHKKPNDKKELKKFFRCKHCDFLTELIEDIKKHSLNHKSNKNKLKKYFKCKHCKFMTEFKGAISRHVKIHQKNIRCCHCDSIFNDDKSYQEHNKKVHSDQFSCSLCGENYNTKLDLKRHKATHEISKIECFDDANEI